MFESMKKFWPTSESAPKRTGTVHVDARELGLALVRGSKPRGVRATNRSNGRRTSERPKLYHARKSPKAAPFHAPWKVDNDG